MPNYTVTRKEIGTDSYGCTNFSTNQIVGTVASLGDYGSGGPLDGDIIWWIDADFGFTINVDDFEIQNTTATSSAQIPGQQRTFEGSGLPSPILGVVMEKVSDTRIKVVIFLHPYDPFGITGVPFTMPPNSVSIVLNITGCAIPAGAGLRNQIVHNFIPPPNIQAPDVVVTTGTEEEGSSSGEGLEVEEVGYGDTTINGVIPRGSFESKIYTYKMTAAEGTRFKNMPVLAISTTEYTQVQTTTYDKLFNIVGIQFDIYKNK